MKQFITKEQWDELTEKQKWFLLDRFYGITKKEENILLNRFPEISPFRYKNLLKEAEDKVFGFGEYWRPPNIGQMIEFLGDDWYYDICELKRDKEFMLDPLLENYLPQNDKLCDIVWGVVKYKLNK